MRWRPIVIIALLLMGCRSLGTDSHPKFKIVGYVRGRADINAIGAEKLTHINYAFAKVNPLGVIDFEDRDAPAHLAQLQALKSRNSQLQLILSVGGWGADFFSDAALTDASRCRFSMSAVDLIKRYALDGIDLDWEYPGQPGPGIGFRAEDRENFTLLLKTLRQELDRLGEARRRRYTLSIASAGGRYFDHTEMDRLHVYLDWINVMAYDLSGGWSLAAGHHTPLYRSALAPANAVSTESIVQQHLDAGIPPRKIVVGVAFYGRGWRGVMPENKGLYQRFDQYESNYPFSAITRDYLAAPGYERRWDSAANAPYLWSAEHGRFISYDDPESLVEKANFVKKHGLGGMMYWEHSHDPSETLLNAIFYAFR
jgi:chitinase